MNNKQPVVNENNILTTYTGWEVFPAQPLLPTFHSQQQFISLQAQPFSVVTLDEY